MRTRWEDPEWQSLEHAHYQAHRQRVAAEVAEARRQLKIELAELALVDADHVLERARVADLSLEGRMERARYPNRTAMEPVEVACAKAVVARDRYLELLNAKYEYDGELFRAECAARRAMDARADVVEGRRR